MIVSAIPRELEPELFEEIERERYKNLDYVNATQGTEWDFKITQTARPPPPASSIDILPDECLNHIFSFLPAEDLLDAEEISERWKTVAQRSWKTFTTLQLSQEIENYRLLNKVLRRSGNYIKTLKILNSGTVNVEKFLTAISGRCPSLERVEFDDRTFDQFELVNLLENYTTRGMLSRLNELKVINILRMISNLPRQKLIQVAAYVTHELVDGEALYKIEVFNLLETNPELDGVFIKTAYHRRFDFPADSTEEPRKRLNRPYQPHPIVYSFYH